MNMSLRFGALSLSQNSTIVQHTLYTTVDLGLCGIGHSFDPLWLLSITEKLEWLFVLSYLRKRSSTQNFPQYKYSNVTERIDILSFAMWDGKFINTHTHTLLVLSSFLVRLLVYLSFLPFLT